jgi:hypothetical protein
LGLEAVAATMNEDAGTSEDVVEPYLLQIGFLARTQARPDPEPRAAAEHLGLQMAPAGRTDCGTCSTTGRTEGGTRRVVLAIGFMAAGARLRLTCFWPASSPRV